MDIVNIKVADIKPYPKNTKKHPAEQISNIAKSIEKYGFIQQYVDVIIARYEKLTGNKAILLT